jgi:hypothetical protein
MVGAGISGRGSPYLAVPGPRGASWLSTEDLRILERAEQRRIDRNAVRATRREEDPDASVSEDEPEELTGILARMTIPVTAGGETEGSGLVHLGNPPVTLTTGPGPALFTDSEAALNPFTTHDNTIPEDILTLVKCRRSVPLQLFAAESLRRIRSGLDIKYIKVATGPAANARILDISDFPKDEDLSMGEWTVCYNTFLAFMTEHSEPKVLRGLLAHFDAMLKDPEFSSWFPAYLLFDMQICNQFFAKPSIIDATSHTWYQALQSAKDSILRKATVSSSASPSHKGQRYAPYTTGRPGSFQSGDGSRGPAGPSLCLRCGLYGDHRAASCKSVEPSRRERPFFAGPSKGKLVRLSDSKTICIRFNLHICSADQKEGHPLHVCSLCGDHHHGAIKCTRN